MGALVRILWVHNKNEACTNNGMWDTTMFTRILGLPTWETFREGCLDGHGNDFDQFPSALAAFRSQKYALATITPRKA